MITIKLSDYLIEKSISDFDTSEIALEQAVAEVNVNSSICEAYMKLMYVTEADGETSDTGFWQKVKNFFISIGNWFRRIVIQLSGWISEKRVDKVIKRLESMTEDEKKNFQGVLPYTDINKLYEKLVNDLDTAEGFLTAGYSYSPEEARETLRSIRALSKHRNTNELNENSMAKSGKYNHADYLYAIKKFKKAITDKKDKLKKIRDKIKNKSAADTIDVLRNVSDEDAKRIYRELKKTYDVVYSAVTSEMTELIDFIKKSEKYLKKNPNALDNIHQGVRGEDKASEITEKKTESDSEGSNGLAETIKENKAFYSSAIRNFMDLINVTNTPDFDERYKIMEKNLRQLLDKNSADKATLMSCAKTAIGIIDSTFNNNYMKSALETYNGQVSKIDELLELFKNKDVCYNITLAIVGLCYHKTNDETCFMVIGKPTYDDAKYKQAGDVCNEFRKCSGNDVIGAIKDFKDNPDLNKWKPKKPVSDDSDAKKEETQSSTNTKANAILDALKDINSVTNNDDVKKYFDEFVKSITEASDDKFNEVLNKSLQKLIFDVDNKLGNTDFVKLINAIHKGTKYTDVFDWPLRGSTVTLEGKSVKEIANSTNISVDDSKRYKVKHLSTPVMGYSDDGKDYIIQAKRATIELTDQEASSDNTGKKKTKEPKKEDADGNKDKGGKSGEWRERLKKIQEYVKNKEKTYDAWIKTFIAFLYDTFGNSKSVTDFENSYNAIKTDSGQYARTNFEKCMKILDNNLHLENMFHEIKKRNPKLGDYLRSVDLPEAILIIIASRVVIKTENPTIFMTGSVFDTDISVDDVKQCESVVSRFTSEYKTNAGKHTKEREENPTQTTGKKPEKKTGQPEKNGDEQQIPGDRLRRLEEVLGETFKLTKPLGDRKYWKNFPELYDEYKEIYDRTIKCYQDMRGKLNTNEETRYNDGYNALGELAGKLPSGDKTVKHSVRALQEIIDALQVSIINSHIYKRIPIQIYIVGEGKTYLVATCEDLEFNLCIKDLEEKNSWITKYYGRAEKFLKEQNDSADGSKKAE